jgi:hypothetical protein
MSPHLHYTIARAQQQEIDARVRRATHAHNVRASSGPSRRSRRLRISQAVAAVGVCAAISTAIAASGAPASPLPDHHRTDISAQRFVTEIRALEHKGFVQYSCTINGTELRNPNTGQVVTVSL